MNQQGKENTVLRSLGSNGIYIRLDQSIKTNDTFVKKDSEPILLQNGAIIVIKFKKVDQLEYTFKLVEPPSAVSKSLIMEGNVVEVDDEKEEEEKDDDETMDPDAAAADFIEQVLSESQSRNSRPTTAEKSKEMAPTRSMTPSSSKINTPPPQTTATVPATDASSDASATPTIASTTPDSRAASASKKSAAKGSTAKYGATASVESMSTRSPIRSVKSPPPFSIGTDVSPAGSIPTTAGASGGNGAQVTALNARIASLKKQAKDMDDDMEQRTKRHADSSSAQRTKINELRTANDAAQETIKKLQTEVKNLENFKGDNSQTVPQMNTAMSALHDEVDEKQGVIEALESQLKIKRGQVADYDAQIDEFNAVITMETEKREKLQGQVLDLSSKLNTKEDAFVAIQEVLADRDAELKRVNSALKGLRDILTSNAEAAMLHLQAISEATAEVEVVETQLNCSSSQGNASSIAAAGDNLSKAQELLWTKNGRNSRKVMSQDTGMAAIQEEDGDDEDDNTPHKRYASQPARIGSGRKRSESDSSSPNDSAKRPKKK
jgi:DNA repair exonuclease SbcCD ATPase subunit